MAIYHSVSQLVGNTPLLSVDNYVRCLLYTSDAADE